MKVLEPAGDAYVCVCLCDTYRCIFVFDTHICDTHICTCK